jgi:cytochrome c-type biogenesis protein CcmF
VDYLKKLPKSYKTGDRVLMVNQVWYCVEDHIASDSFLADLEDSVWSSELMGDKHILKAKPWANGVAGELMFSLSPSILMSPKGNSREPSIKHSLSEDLYTFLKYAEIEKPAVDEEGFLQPREQNVKPGSQIISGDLLIIVDSLQAIEDSLKLGYGLLPDDLAARTVIKLRKKGIEKTLEPLFILRGTSVVPHVVEDKEFGIKLMVRQILPEDGSLNLVVWEHQSVVKDFIVYHAIIFPQINVLWLGCLVMVIGTTMAIRHRIRLSKAKASA